MSMNMKQDDTKARALTVLALLAAIGFVLLFESHIVSADLGTFAQGDCVNIRTILNTTSANLSTVSSQSQTYDLNAAMTNLVGKTFNYTFCDTLDLGLYTYDYFDAEGNVYVNGFTITPAGNASNVWYFIFITVLFYFIAIFGFVKKIGVMSSLGGLGMLALGVYFANGGLDIYRDTITLWVSYLTIGLGGYFALAPVVDVIAENFR